MFSNPRKFFKKNVLLIGIVVLLIIIAIYWLYTNYKEGFDQPVPGKAQLIPISTIEKLYNNLPDPIYKDIGAPIVGLYKLFVDNYNDAFEVSLQIVAATQEADAALASVPVPQPVNPDNINHTAEDQANMTVYYNLRTKANLVVQQKWAPIINPGIQRVLTNAIKWLPTAKQFYDKFVSNNYYGLFDGTIIKNKPDIYLTLVTMCINTLYEDDQLATLLGPTFAKSNPNLPIKLPTTNEQLMQFERQNASLEVIRPAEIYFRKYFENLTLTFSIIERYLMKNAMENGVNSIIPNTIIQLIEQLNNALANDATDQATIGQLTGNLNAALANDATDQATIHNLQGKVTNLASRLCNRLIRR